MENMIDYKMDLPVSEKYNSFNNILEVDSKLFKVTYKLAKYFKEEFNYDTVPFNENGMLNKPFKALLFTEQALDRVKNSSMPTPYRIYGACLFSELKIADETHWKLEWIWFHPFFRHRGKLSKHWNELEERFGNFFIGKPISNDMEQFLKKINSQHICY